MTLRPRWHDMALGLLPALLSAIAPPVLAQAQDFPAKTIKLVVPFPAGGPADIFGRVIAEKLATLAGQTVIVENRTGAGGVSGVAVVAKSEPDGHTIGIASSGALAISVSLQDAMQYDPLKDLKLLTQAVSVPELLVTGQAVPANTLAELIALAKAQPGKLNYASTGLGSMPHMAAELFKIGAGIDVVHVPYAGAAPAVNDLLGGHVQMMFADVPVLLGSVQAGKLTALAVGSTARIPTLPDVKTTVEQGLPEVLADNWYGMVAPAAIPAVVAVKLQSMLVQTLTAPEVKAKLAEQGAFTVGNSSAEFEAHVRGETAKWAKVIRTANIKVK